MIFEVSIGVSLAIAVARLGWLIDGLRSRSTPLAGSGSREVCTAGSCYALLAS
jgi:hypothetical protein